MGDNGDAFPFDPAEWSDGDGDLVGDNGDAFPADPGEWADSDLDGVGDNGDAFPFDPTEWADSDGDGVGDNADAFPADPGEWADSDGDLVGDNADAFPLDPAEQSDADGDGVGDNGDAFPDDPGEWADTDGDGVGDNADLCPLTPDPGQDDMDGDLVGDVCDGDADGDGVPAVAGDCEDLDPAVYPGAPEACDGQDYDCDGFGPGPGDPECAGASCDSLLQDDPSLTDGVYWIDPGDTGTPWEAWCDMTRDDGGWIKLFSSHHPTWWSASDYHDVGEPEDDDMSALVRLDEVDDAGTWTFRLEVGNSGTWDTVDREHFTIWTQDHNPDTSATDGSDYGWIAGEEMTTCGGFNGLHNHGRYHWGTWCMMSDVDTTDGVGCWWIQLVPISDYNGNGYLEGYVGPNYHEWQVLWVK